MGVSADSLYIWQQKTNGEWYVNDRSLFDWGSEWYPAYSVAELGELLPEKVVWHGYGNYSGKWHLKFGDFEAISETEADTKALMLIYLIENKLITI